jgi:hypothetical protein
MSHIYFFSEGAAKVFGASLLGRENKNKCEPSSLSGNWGPEITFLMTHSVTHFLYIQFLLEIYKC